MCVFREEGEIEKITRKGMRKKKTGEREREREEKRRERERRERGERDEKEVRGWEVVPEETPGQFDDQWRPQNLAYIQQQPDLARDRYSIVWVSHLPQKRRKMVQF